MPDCLFTACHRPATASSVLGACALHEMELGREMAQCFAHDCSAAPIETTDTRWRGRYCHTHLNDLGAAVEREGAER